MSALTLGSTRVVPSAERMTRGAHLVVVPPVVPPAALLGALLGAPWAGAPAETRMMLLRSRVLSSVRFSLDISCDESDCLY
jgi:hypothetical protein